MEPYLSVCESASGLTFGQTCFNVCGEGCNWRLVDKVVIKIWQKTNSLQKSVFLVCTHLESDRLKMFNKQVTKKN